jgi:hypothetical protein
MVMLLLGSPGRWPAIPKPFRLPSLARSPACSQHGVSLWLMDTGCGYDLVQRSDISRCGDLFALSPVPCRC